MPPPPDLAVDPLSLAEFQRTLQARLDETFAALMRIDRAGAAPALGGFEDAQRATQRHQHLQAQARARLQRLAGALIAAQAATAAIAARYTTVEELNAANIAEALRPLVLELERGHHHA